VRYTVVKRKLGAPVGVSCEELNIQSNLKARRSATTLAKASSIQLDVNLARINSVMFVGNSRRSSSSRISRWPNCLWHSPNSWMTFWRVLLARLWRAPFNSVSDYSEGVVLGQRDEGYAAGVGRWHRPGVWSLRTKVRHLPTTGRMTDQPCDLC
jgi:hypothetical protein